MPKPNKHNDSIDFLTACTMLRERMEAKKKKADDNLQSVINFILNLVLGSKLNEKQ